MFYLMGSRRFLPASILERHRDFGRLWNAPVQIDEPYPEGVLAWAVYQHMVAFIVLGHLDSQTDPRRALEDLADRLRVSPGWLLRKFHGQASASLAKMAEWLIELELEAPSFETAIAAAIRANPYGRDLVAVPAEDVSPEELERVRAERLETLARVKEESRE